LDEGHGGTNRRSSGDWPEAGHIRMSQTVFAITTGFKKKVTYSGPRNWYAELIEKF